MAAMITQRRLVRGYTVRLGEVANKPSAGARYRQEGDLVIDLWTGDIEGFEEHQRRISALRAQAIDGQSGGEVTEGQM